jgi:hypothetical protein
VAVRYVYFTKTLRELDVKGLIAFCKEVGLDGLDLAVRPGYPVHPGNVGTALPEAVRACRDAGLTIGLVTASTDLTDPEGRPAQALFEACGRAGLPAQSAWQETPTGPLIGEPLRSNCWASHPSTEGMQSRLKVLQRACGKAGAGGRASLVVAEPTCTFSPNGRAPPTGSAPLRQAAPGRPGR